MSRYCPPHRRLLPASDGKGTPPSTRKRRPKKKATVPKQNGNAVTSRSVPSQVDTWDIFGFTEGADTGAAGDKSVFSDVVIRYLRSQAGLIGLRRSTGINVSINERLSVWLAGIGSLQRDESLPGQPMVANAGMLFGWKYRVLPREADGLGISVHAEPFWERAVSGNATVRQTAGSDLQLMVDRALVPGSLFAAINIGYQPQTVTSIDGATRSESAVEVSGALSRRFFDNVFIGVEARYARSHDGNFLNRSLGWAILAGPTLHATIGPNGYFGIAWSAQLFGRAAGEPRGSLDLTNYERHQARFKLGFSF